MNKEDLNQSAVDIDSKAQLTVYASQASTLRCFELISILSWRLGFLCLIGSALVAALAYLLNVKHLSLGLGWLLVASLQIICLSALFRSRNEHFISRLALFLALSLLLWWGLMVVFMREVQLLPELFLGFLLLEVAVLPLAIRHFLIYCATTVVIYALWSMSGAYSVMGLLVLTIVLPAALRNACISRINFNSRLAGMILIESCKHAPDTETILRLLCCELARIGDTAGILVSVPGQLGKVLLGDEFVDSKIDAVFERGLIERAEELRLEDGFLSRTELGQQFYAPLSDWFGRLPANLMFSHLSGVSQAQEKDIYLFFPMEWTARMAGKKRSLFAVAGITSIARIALAYQRSRFISSGVLSSTQRSISEQERELDHIIHRVNNTAQDISVVCDGVLSRLKQESTEIMSADVRENLQRELQNIENAITTLSSDVSDNKLLKEMLQIRSLERFELVSLGPLLDQIKMYAQYRFERRSVAFNLQNDVEQDLVLKVVSTALMGTALRLLLRYALRRSAKEGSQVRMHVYFEQDQVVFAIEDNCEQLSPDVLGYINGTGTTLAQSSAAFEVLQPLLSFINASKGKFSYQTAAAPYVNRLLCRLSAKVRVRDNTPVPGNWALLVDDNGEVTTFYSRIAEALKLRYNTAASVAEALKIVEANGKPRLVITDIQLGDSSGLDLVRDLRRQFGTSLPVIVVSGKADDNLAATIQRAGATTYLTKPVGRQRLFAEIQEVLSK